MSTINEADPAKRRWLLLLPCLLGSVALANAAGAGQTQAAAVASAGYAPALAASYRVINLGVGELASTPQINDSGQVAYTLSTGQALFYNGTSIVPIGPLPGPPGGSIGLNNLGQVAGSYLLPDGFNGRGYVWSQAGGVTVLPTLGGNSGFAFLINDRGQVAGNSTAPNSFPHAFLWSPATGIEDVGAFPDASLPITNANAINNNGMVVGWGLNANGDSRGFVWTRKTGLIDVGTLGGSSSSAIAVNDSGQVAGSAAFPGDRRFHAFLWYRDGGLQDIGVPGNVNSSAADINEKGQVLGTVIFPTKQRTFLWARTGGWADLGTLGGVTTSSFTLNDRGQVVGGSTTRQEVYRAFAWSAKDGIVDLNKRLRYAPAGLVVDFAVAISNNGSIVATSNAGLVLLKPDCNCNGTHAVGPIALPDMVAVGMPVDAAASFAGADTAARHHVSWSWGDGSGDQVGHVRESGGAGSGIGSHTYAAPGIYTVSATVTDLGGKSATATRRIVVYDKAAGSMRGSGQFASPQGADRQARSQTGVAAFAFVASPATQAGAAKAELQFHSGTLNFRSRRLTPVALQGRRAQYEGSGTINGQGDYRFTLSTTAGGTNEPGRFGLKVWHADPATGAAVVDYDNLSAGAGDTGPAVQGSIVHQQ